MNTNHFSLVDHRLAKMIGLSVLAALMIAIATKVYAAGASATGSPPPVAPGDEELYSSAMASPGLVAGPWNSMIWGPDICAGYGDPGVPSSPWADNVGGKYTYRIAVPNSYAEDLLRVELFDPDTGNPLEHYQSPDRYTVYNLDGTSQLSACSASLGRKDTCSLFTTASSLPDWQVRLDENRGNGVTGQCSPGETYNGTFNTATLFRLYYYEEQPEGGMQEVDLAYYVGKRDDPSQPPETQAEAVATDLQWVSPGAPSGQQMPAFDLAYVQADPVLGQLGWSSSGDVLCTQSGHCFLPSAAEPPTTTENCETYRQSNPTYTAAQRCQGNGDFVLDLTNELSGITANADGTKSIYLDVRTLSGASENGYEVWAGPQRSAPSAVNSRNLLVRLAEAESLQNPRDMEGVQIYAERYLPVNVLTDNPSTVVLTHLEPEDGGQQIPLTAFDVEYGAVSPIYFYLDTFPKTDWAACYADNAAQCTAAGLNAASYLGPAQFVHYTWAEYQFTLPNTINGNPFPGGNLLVSFRSGITDSQTWQLGFMPASPTLLSPSNGASTADSTPDFDWSDVTGATQYQIQVADYYTGFSSPVIDATTTDSIYTPTSALADGRYSWRVRTLDGDWGDYSSTWTVTLNTPPIIPTLISPANGSTTGDSTPDFNWSDITGATEYQIQVDDNADFSSPAIDTTTTMSAHAPTTALAIGVYSWRVRAFTDTWNGYSNAWTVTIVAPPATPTLVSPANSSTIDDGTPTFDWSDVAGVTQYQIQLGTNADFSSATYYYATASTYTLTSVLANGTYYWRVRGSNGVWGDYSSTWTLTIAMPPILVSPANGSVTGDNTPDFDWSDVTGATQYQLQVDDNSDFSSPAIDTTTTTSAYTPTTALAFGTYSWRVRAYNLVWSNYSSARTVTLAMPPTLVSPANGSVIADSTPDFDWEDVAGATQYQIQVANNADFSSWYYTTTTTSSHTWTWNLANGTYYWRVRGSNGVWGDYSSTWTLTIAVPPAVPTLTSPANGSATADSTPTFDWDDVTVATQYQIQVDDNADFSSPAIDTTTTLSAYTPTTALALGTYSWRVRAYDLVWGNYSSARTVTIAVPPAIPTLISPANGSTIDDGTPTFDWDDVAGATQYEIQFANNAGFSNSTSSTITTSSYTYTWGLINDTYYWRVRASNGVWSAYSDAWTMTVDAPPAAPSLASPYNGAGTGDNTPIFDWYAVTGATQYQIQVDDNTDFSSPAIDTTTTDTIYTPTSALAIGVYSWRVRAYNGVWGEYSNVWTLTIAVPPAIPTLVSPPNGSTIDDNTPTFDWGDVAGATQYQIQVDDNVDFSSPVIDTTTAASTYTSPTLTNGTYYWRLRARNSLWGNYSSTWTVTVDIIPAVPILWYPSNGSFTANNTPTFRWYANLAETEYQLQVDDNADFSSPEVDTVTTDSDYTPTSGLAIGIYYWHVRGRNGRWSDYSDTSTLTIVVPPSKPVLVSPADSSTTTDNTPTFDWDDVTGATQYQMQVDDNADFSSPVVSTYIYTTASGYTLNWVLPNAAYYWHVRAYNGVLGEYSDVWMVTVATPPAMPSLASPANGSATGDNTPTFDWGNNLGATQYQIQVDDNADFSSPVLDTTTTTSAYTPTSALAIGVYSWRVRAYDIVWGAYSSVWTVTIAVPPAIPTLTSPANGSTTDDNTPTFDWGDVAGATQYQIQVDDSADFSSPVVSTTITTSSYTRTSALPNTTYYWHVQARNTVWSDYSSAWTVTVAAPPAMLSPANGSATGDNTPNFDWYDVTGVTQYQIQVDDNADFSSPAIDATTTDSIYTPLSTLALGVYSWRVRAYNGLWGAYSTAWVVTIALPPATPTLTSPANGSTTDDNTPTFDWNDVAGATQYQIQVDDNADFSSPVVSTTTTTSSYTRTSALLNTTYYWHVQARNNVWSDYSSAWTVTVAALPAVPALALPANGSATGDNTPNFDWWDVTGATQYQIQVDDNTDFSSPLLDIARTTSTYTPTSALALGVYSWRARAYNGLWGAYSSVWTVTITMPAAIPMLVSPPDGSTTDDNTPTFDWEDITGAIQYHIQVDDSADFSSPVVSTYIATSTYTPTSILPNTNYYWRVEASNGAWSDFSSAWVVTIAAPPAAPTLASPANGSITADSTPSFDWNSVTGATQYQIQVDDNTDFSSPAIDATTTTSIYTPTSELAIGTYSWRVRAYNGLWSAYSSARTVTIAVPPAAPILVSPANGSITDDSTPTFDWDDVTGATQYQIQVDDNGDFSSLVTNTYTGASVYTLTAVLPNTAYYWRVRVSNGLWSDYSSVWTVTVAAPATATPTPTATPSGTNIIVNPGFESGVTPWTLDGFVETTRPHTGTYSARLCGSNICSDSVAQQITVPASGVLTYWWYMTTSEGTGTAYDYLRVRLYTTGGSLITTLRTWSNTSTRSMWMQDTISLSAYAGQTVGLRFLSTTDSSLSSTFFVDDVEVR